MEDQKLEALSVDKLEALIRHHNALYWDHGKPEISDYEYDRLVRRLRALAPDSAVLEEMGPSRAAPSTEAEFRHKQRMLSLDKCYGEEDLNHWGESFEGPVVMSPKFDGIACALHYNERGELTLAVTRGDGAVGENITVNAREIKDLPKKVDARGIEVRGEIFMKLSVFKGFKDQGFSNPRNLTAGAIKLKDSAKSAAYNLSFAAYDLLGTDHKTESDKMEFLAKIGFPPVEREVLEKGAMQAGYEALAKKRPALDFEIDGVVFKVDAVSEQKRLGATAHHPRYAIAYKFQGDSGTTVLRDIEWSVARSGAITPVGIIDPVSLSGAMVSRASLHHPGFITKLGLTKGAEVVVMRRGGVIPNIEFMSKPGTEPIVIPTACPSCGSPVRFEKEFLYCTKPAECKNAVVGQLAHFAATTGMLGFGDVVLANAYDKGVLRRPADFFTLTEAKLLTVDRMAEKGARNLLAQVERIRTLDLATFLRAFGLPELGKHVSAILADRFHTLDRIYDVTAEELGAVHSIGEVIAKAVVHGLRDAKGEIEAVRKHVKLVEATPSAAAASGPFAGQSFVFTGKMATMERKDAEALVKSLGGAAHDAVSKALTFLVVGDKKTADKSTKQKAAEKLVAAGVPIQVITESDFLARAESAKSAAAAMGEAETTEEDAVEASAAATTEAEERSHERVVARPAAAHEEAKGAAGKEPHEAKGARAEGTAHADGGGGATVSSLAGKAFVFAGKLAAISLEDATQRVQTLGGQVRGALDGETTHLVVGAKGKPGAQLTEARARQGKGEPIAILDEGEFVKLVGTKQAALF